METPTRTADATSTDVIDQQEPKARDESPGSYFIERWNRNGSKHYGTEQKRR